MFFEFTFKSGRKAISAVCHGFFGGEDRMNHIASWYTVANEESSSCILEILTRAADHVSVRYFSCTACHLLLLH